MSASAARSSGGTVGRAFALLATATLLAAGPTGAGAQQGRPDPLAHGDGFLFHQPNATFSLRGGYSRANASSELFTSQQKQLTIGPRGFDRASFGADLSFHATRRIDLGVSFDGTARSRRSEYRDWLDQNDKPIEQTTKLSTLGFSANLKYNLRDRGRAISSLAWIPARYVPYVGIGGGVINYEFTQTGDFIVFPSMQVFPDKLRSANWGAMAQVFSGFAYTLTTRWSLISEARYTASSLELNKDYSDFGRINLSGLAVNVGTSIRF